MHAGDIDAWNEDQPARDIFTKESQEELAAEAARKIGPIDMDIPVSMGLEDFKKGVSEGQPQVNGIKDPQLTTSQDKNGHITFHCNAEGLMVLRELVEEAFLNATLSTYPQKAPHCTVMTPRFKRPDATELVLKLHIEDFEPQKSRLAKVWTHHARENGHIVEHHDNP